MHALVLGLSIIGAIALAIVGVRLLNPLPPLHGRELSTYIAGDDTQLGRVIEPLARAHPGESGLRSLADARDAFAARVLLARAAERSLDVQYYIWHDDITGTLLFEELHAAAERGVRVRLLLDDNNTSGLDILLRALDTHRNIQVRLFNPFVIRSPRVVGYLTDFARLNRRMHNKSFTADSQATIVGGRNIGDEYFGASLPAEPLFADLDVLAVGPIAQEVARDFDRYWASGSAYPAERVLPDVEPAQLGMLQARAAASADDPDAAEYMQAVMELPFVAALLDGELELDWAPTRMLSDDPAKGLDAAAPEQLLATRLRAAFGEPTASLDLVSPYFVPGPAAIDMLRRHAQNGVRVRVLVNSLEATDVAAVHAGYVDARKPLLEAGVELYEMRLVGETARRDTGPLGSSASSLHAKTFAADARLFVGSFNFDPRSSHLNTELGFVMEGTELANRLHATLDDVLPAAAYRLQLSDNGDLYWLENRDGRTVRHDVEPGTTATQRGVVRVLSWLPIESLL